MAFKKAQPAQVVPDSPEKILLDLPRRKIPSVLYHQGEVIREYVAQAQKASDVALQLPTGSGKTLVGLLIGEWRRRKFKERIVYLCPTRQLVNQVVEQADEQYGLTVHGFTGSSNGYDPVAKAEYLNADRMAVTTYSSLFNTKPFFDDPQVIIVDDAHAAENYIAGPWMLKIDRFEPDHAVIHTAVSGVLKQLLDPMNYARLLGQRESIADVSWVDKIPTPSLAEVHDELVCAIEANVDKTDLRFAWTMLREHLLACQLYITSQDILLRPLIPPTWTHQPFAGATQRLFMSATLGAGGDLERLTGRRNILRLPVPKDWDRQGIGRRYFLFPSMALKEGDALGLRRKLMERAGRSLVLVPSDQARVKISSEITEELGFKVFTAENIETSKRPFIQEAKAVAVVAGRYDGIDFPGDDCRLLLINGLPRAINAQERFIMARMAANTLFNERIQTRVLQAIGRCTRSLQDYSAVVVSGDELPEYLNNRDRRSFLHPELQAELEFGIEQSMGADVAGLLDNFDIFLKNDREWEEANEQILNKRAAAVRQPFPAIDELQSVVQSEIEYQERLWQKDYESSLAAAERVLGKLGHSDLRGYRALWHYLAGSSAWLGSQSDSALLLAKARLHYSQAKEAARSISWLVELSRFQDPSSEIETKDNALIGQLERVEAVLVRLGNLHDRQYSAREAEILEGLAGAEKFENAQRLLGEMLGFDAGKEESDGSPDPWWISERVCFVFEDHANANPTSVLDVTKARQAFSHPNWMREKALLADNFNILPVLVTPVSTAKEGAMPHLKEVALWPLEDFRQWATNALGILRELRRTFLEPGNLAWRAQAAESFEQNGLDASSLYKGLKANPASKKLSPVK